MTGNLCFGIRLKPVEDAGIGCSNNSKISAVGIEQAGEPVRSGDIVGIFAGRDAGIDRVADGNGISADFAPGIAIRNGMFGQRNEHAWRLEEIGVRLGFGVQQLSACYP